MSAAAPEAFLKEFLEFCVEDGVDDGVESTVDVAQPGDSAHQIWRDVARQTHSAHRVDHKEWSPAEQEATCMKIRKGKSELVTRFHLYMTLNRNLSNSDLVFVTGDRTYLL